MAFRIGYSRGIVRTGRPVAAVAVTAAAVGLAWAVGPTARLWPAVAVFCLLPAGRRRALPPPLRGVGALSRGRGLLAPRRPSRVGAGVVGFGAPLGRRGGHAWSPRWPRGWSSACRFGAPFVGSARSGPSFPTRCSRCAHRRPVLSPVAPVLRARARFGAGAAPLLPMRPDSRRRTHDLPATAPPVVADSPRRWRAAPRSGRLLVPRPVALASLSAYGSTALSCWPARYTALRTRRGSWWAVVPASGGGAASSSAGLTASHHTRPSPHLANRRPILDSLADLYALTPSCWCAGGARAWRRGIVAGEVRLCA